MTSLAFAKCSRQLGYALIISLFLSLTKGENTNGRKKHFELLPEPTVREAQKALLDEITPSITHLLSLASNHIDKLARREEALKAKCELQEGRLSHEERLPSASSYYKKRRATLAEGGGKTAELKKLTQKKERLRYTVERLELQSRQRERELRKSMAIQRE